MTDSTIEPMPEERLRNTRAWAFSRIGQMSGAEVIVSAIDELLKLRQRCTCWDWGRRQYDPNCPVHPLIPKSSSDQ